MVAPCKNPTSAARPDETGEMHGDALELERDRAGHLGLDRELTARQALEGRDVRPGVRDAGVPRHGLDQRREAPRVPLQQELLHAAVLIAEVNLEVMHLLAEAHEAERTGLDDTGVNGAHGDLVNLLPFDLVEGIGVHGRLLLALIANGLEPGMPRHPDACLLVKLAFEAMESGHLRRELVISELGRQVGSRQLDGPRAVAEHCRDRDVVVAPLAIEGQHPRTRPVPAEDVVPPFLGPEHSDGARPGPGEPGRTSSRSLDGVRRPAGRER